MSIVQDEIVIAAPIERVWETVMNPRRLEDWVTIHKLVENAPRPPLREGATMDQSLSVRGITFRVHWRLVSVDPPHAARWEGRGPAHSNAYIEYELHRESEDRTSFRYTNEFHPPGGKLGAVAGHFIVGATSARETRTSLQRLKELLENAAVS